MPINTQKQVDDDQLKTGKHKENDDKTKEFAEKIEKKTIEEKKEKTVKAKINQIDPATLPTYRCREIIDSLNDGGYYIDGQNDFKIKEEVENYFQIPKGEKKDRFLANLTTEIVNDPKKYWQFYEKSKKLTTYQEYRQEQIDKKKAEYEQKQINTQTKINYYATEPANQPSLLRRATDYLKITPKFKTGWVNIYEQDLKLQQNVLNGLSREEEEIKQMDEFRDQIVDDFIILETAQSKKTNLEKSKENIKKSVESNFPNIVKYLSDEKIITDLKGDFNNNKNKVIKSITSDKRIIPRNRVELGVYLADFTLDQLKPEDDPKKDKATMIKNSRDDLIKSMDGLLTAEDYGKIKKAGSEIGQLMGKKNTSYEFMESKAREIQNNLKLTNNDYTKNLGDALISRHVLTHPNYANLKSFYSNLTKSSLTGLQRDENRAILDSLTDGCIEELNKDKLNESKIIPLKVLNDRHLDDNESKLCIDEVVPEIISEKVFIEEHRDFILEIRKNLSMMDKKKLDLTVLNSTKKMYANEEDFIEDYDFNTFNTNQRISRDRYYLLKRIFDEKKLESILKYENNPNTLVEIKEKFDNIKNAENLEREDFNKIFQDGGYIAHGFNDINVALDRGYQVATIPLNVSLKKYETEKKRQNPGVGLCFSLNASYFSDVDILFGKETEKCPTLLVSAPIILSAEGKLSGGLDRKYSEFSDDNRSIRDMVSYRGESIEFLDSQGELVDDHKFKLNQMILFVPKNLRINPETGLVTNDQENSISSEEYFTKRLNNLPEGGKPKYAYYFDIDENDRRNTNLHDVLGEWRQSINLRKSGNKTMNILLSTMNKKDVLVYSPITGDRSLEGYGTYVKHNIPDDASLERNYSDAINDNVKITTFNNYERESLSSLGSTNGGIYRVHEALYDDRFYLKIANNSEEEGRMWNEQLADNIYRHLGFDVPETEIVNIQTADGIKLAHASKWIERANKKPDQTEFNKGFIADCLMGNWDVPLNNYIEGKEDKKIYRIDNGGALLYRAQGERKKLSRDFNHSLDNPNERILWEDRVPEIDTFRQLGYYQNLDKAEITSQIYNLKQNLADDDIERLSYTVKMKFEDRKLIQEILKNRRDYIINNKSDIVEKFPLPQ